MKQPRTRREVLKYGKKLGGVIVEGGRHTKIYNPETGRSVPVPRHSGDIPRGTMGSILKTLGAMFALLALSMGGVYLILIGGGL